MIFTKINCCRRASLKRHTMRKIQISMYQTILCQMYCYAQRHTWYPSSRSSLPYANNVWVIGRNEMIVSHPYLIQNTPRAVWCFCVVFISSRIAVDSPDTLKMRQMILSILKRVITMSTRMVLVCELNSDSKIIAAWAFIQFCTNCLCWLFPSTREKYEMLSSDEPITWFATVLYKSMLFWKSKGSSHHYHH